MTTAAETNALAQNHAAPRQAEGVHDTVTWGNRT